jgi:hypothetical protein
MTTTHIAHEDILISIDHSPTELVAQILAPAPDPSVQALGLPQVSALLKFRKLSFSIAVEPLRLQALPFARHRRILDPEVDPDAFPGRDTGLNGHLDGKTQPPVAHRIVGEAALPPLDPTEPLGLEHPKSLPAESDAPALTLEVGRLEWNPPQRAS